MSLASPTSPTSPTKERPRWVRLPEEAKLRGFSTEGLRRWCLARHVPIHQHSHRDAWVKPEDIDAAVERLPVATRVKRATPDDIDAELEALPGRRR